MRIKIYTLILTLIYSSQLLATNYYVNDNSLTGDIYCTAIGASGNNGTSANTPKALLSQIISSYILTANDVVYIDKGTYTDAITFTSSDQGTSSGLLNIIGAGLSNTIINCNTAANTVYLNDADYISFDGATFNMTSAGGSKTTFYIEKSSTNNIIKNCKITSNYSGAYSTPDLYFALAISSTSSALIPSFNLIQNNIIETTKYGIYLKGHSATNSQMADGNIFSGNTITFTGGTTTLTPSNYIYYTKNTVIKRNKIQNFFSGLFFGTSTGTSDENVSLQVFNNYFSSDDSNSDQFCGIHIKNPNTSSADIRIYNNTFYFKNGAYGCLHLETANSSAGVKVYNNIFQIPSSAIPSTGYSTILTFDSSTPTKLDSIDYNYYGTGGLDLSCRSTTCYSTLASYKAYDHDNRASKTGDENSLWDGDYSDPLFVSPNSHNLDLQSNSPMLAKAKAIWGIDRDINSFSRPNTGATPISIGADDNGNNYLPVALIDFHLSKNVNQVNLFWKTISETNNKEFIIEKSNNSIDFVQIGKIKGAGNSNSLLEYKFTDYSINNSKGSSYYRLRQNDYDGKYEYSNTISISKMETINSIILISSNIVKTSDKLKFEINNEKYSSINFQVISIDGKIIHNAYHTIEKGTSIISIDLPQMDSGQYILKTINENGNYNSFKFIYVN